jgi:hypothetical protein
MSTGISNSALQDLIKTTLPNLPNLDFEYALKYQEWLVVNEWFAGDKIQEESGTNIQRNIVLDSNGNAKFVRLYQKTSIGHSDTQRQDQHSLVPGPVALVPGTPRDAAEPQAREVRGPDRKPPPGRHGQPRGNP